MNVEEVMTKTVVSLQPQDSLGAAAQIMWEQDCGCVPVVDGGGCVVGIVTDRDGFMAAYTQGRSLRDIPVGTAMAHKVYTCGPSDAVEEAEKLMQDAQVRRLPVVDRERRLVGIVSLGDIARHYKGAGARSGNGLTSEPIARTLAAISGPHAHAVQSA